MNIYVRYSSADVAQTLKDTYSGVIVHLDEDAELVGIEHVGAVQVTVDGVDVTP